MPKFETYDVCTDITDASGARAAYRLNVPSLPRIVEITASFVLILVMLPLMLVLALLVALDVRSMPIQWHREVGTNGATTHRQYFQTLGKPYDDAGQRLTDAERTSLFGQFLENTKLATLPQLWNVLVGKSSFS